MRPTTRIASFSPLILFVSVLIYIPGLSGPLLFDDKPALTANERVQIDGTVLDEWRVAAFSSSSGVLRRPVAMLSFAVNHAVSGKFSPVSIKVTNVAVHLLIAVLLYFFLFAVVDALAIVPDKFNRQLLAATAAAIWLLHPLNVSTVLYSVQRMAQLATLCVVGGLLVFMHYRQRWAMSGASSGEVLAAGLWLIFLSLMAVLSKENGALLPWLIVVLEVCVFRGAWAGRPNRGLCWGGWVLLVLPIVLALLFLVYSPLSVIGGYAWREFTLEERLLTQARLLWRYLGWIIFPNINDMGFQHDDIPLSSGLISPPITLLALLAWPLVLGVALVARQRFPLLLLAVLFFLIGHSMESTVLPLEMVYEHRNYLPAVLVCLGVAYVLVVPAVQSERINVWYPVLGTITILCLLLFIRVQTWSSELTLSQVNVARHPASSRSNYFYAKALLRKAEHTTQQEHDGSQNTESLLLARHHFERMYQTNNRDMAALVMLFYMDSRYFPEMLERVDWLAELDGVLDSGMLQPSDWNALAMLFEMSSAESGAENETQIINLLNELSDKYPSSAHVLRYRYLYLAARNAEPAELLPLLQQGQRLDPSAAWLYRYLMYESARNQDIAGIYDNARLWLLNDPQRYDLHQQKGMLTEAAADSEVSGD